jgi:hypothetical protein
MARRDRLKAGLVTAWHRCIEQYVDEQRVNSERSLQAAFWACLNKELHKSRRIFIEPAIRFDAPSDIYFPDLLICNTQEVIGVVELKYTPRIKACIKKDISTICNLAAHQGELFVSNSRYRGEIKQIKKYSFSGHVLFAWAGVHCEERDQVVVRFQERLKEVGDIGNHSLLQLHAVTDSKRKAEVVVAMSHRR